MNERLLIRLLLMVRNPPSRRMRVIIAAVVVLSALVFGAEYFGLLPDWMATRGHRMPRIQVN